MTQRTSNAKAQVVGRQPVLLHVQLAIIQRRRATLPIQYVVHSIKSTWLLITIAQSMQHEIWSGIHRFARVRYSLRVSSFICYVISVSLGISSRCLLSRSAGSIGSRGHGVGSTHQHAHDSIPLFDRTHELAIAFFVRDRKMHTCSG